MTKRAFFIFLISIFPLATLSLLVAASVTIFDELNAPTAGNDYIATDGPLYESFLTGPSPLSLSDVMIKLTIAHPGTNANFSSQSDKPHGMHHLLDMPAAPPQGASITVGLYSDVSTHPGSLLVTIATFPDSSLPAQQGYANFDFPVNPAFTLMPNTRYWIGVTGTNQTVAGLAWTHDITGTGSATEFNVFNGKVYPNSSGPYQMRITAAAPNTVGPPASITVVSGDNQTGVSGTALSAPLVVAVFDSNHNAVPAATVTFIATNASVIPASALTDANGRATTQVTLGNTSGPATVIASIAGVPSLTFHLTATANPSFPNITAVVNGASFQPGIVAGSWLTIQGTNLSATTRAWNASDFLNGALPTKLDNVSVSINGKAAFVYYISPGQLNVLAPDDAATGPVAVQVTSQGVTSNTFSANKVSLSPALFLFTSRYPAAVHLDGTYLGPLQLIAGAAIHPAHPNETVLLFGTGFGPTTPVIPTGSVFTNAAPLAQTVTATVGGMPADVHGYLISPGLYQFNLTLPDLPDGDAAVVINVGGSHTPDGLFITIAK